MRVIWSYVSFSSKATYSSFTLSDLSWCHGQKIRANVAIMAGGQVLWLSPHQTARFPRQAALNAQAATLIRNHQTTMQPTT